MPNQDDQHYYVDNPQKTHLANLVLILVTKEILLRDRKTKQTTGEIIKRPTNRDSISREPHRLDGNNSSFYLMWQGGCLGCLIPIILVILTLFFMLRI